MSRPKLCKLSMKQNNFLLPLIPKPKATQNSLDTQLFRLFEPLRKNKKETNQIKKPNTEIGNAKQL